MNQLFGSSTSALKRSSKTAAAACAGFTLPVVRLFSEGGTDGCSQHLSLAKQHSAGYFHNTAGWYAQLKELDDSQRKPGIKQSRM
jgi:hypothetical protein